MVGNGVVVVPVWRFLSICFSFINLGFVACYLISLGLDCDFYPLGFLFLSMFFEFFFWKISIFFGLITVGSRFWVLCNCSSDFLCSCSLCASDTKSPDGSGPLIRRPEPLGSTKRSGGCRFIFCSPDLIRSSVGQAKTWSKSTREQP